MKNVTCHEITSTGGELLGVFIADTPEAALDAMARQAGDADFAAYAERTGSARASLKIDTFRRLDLGRG
jgi:hypothetical protein